MQHLSMRCFAEYLSPFVECRAPVQSKEPIVTQNVNAIRNKRNNQPTICSMLSSQAYNFSTFIPFSISFIILIRSSLYFICSVCNKHVVGPQHFIMHLVGACTCMC